MIGSELRNLILKIRNETKNRGNTRGRVADTFNGMMDFIDSKFIRNSSESLTHLGTPTITDNTLNLGYTGEDGIEQKVSVDLSAFDPDLSGKLDKPTQAPQNGEVLKYYGGENVWSPAETDTLDSVALRGSHSSVPITIQDTNYNIGYDPALKTVLLGSSVNPLHTGTRNTLVGADLPNLTSGYLNVAIGKGALAGVTTGFANTLIGTQQVNGNIITGKHNTGIGYGALNLLTSGRWNLAIGTGSSGRITTGSGNIAIGYGSNNFVTTGNRNIAIGTYAGPNRSSETVLSNKFIVENRLPNVTSEDSFWDGTPLPTTFAVSSSFIYGDFELRTLNFDAKLSVTPTRMPTADGTYTKNLVANPNGTFGWEDKASLSGYATTPELDNESDERRAADQVLQEQITRNNSYSTAETLTGGTWIDGKPIYRRVIEGVTDAEGVWNYNTLGAETSIHTCVSSTFLAESFNGFVTMPEVIHSNVSNYPSSLTGSLAIVASGSNAYMQGRVWNVNSQAPVTGKNVKAILEYTKLT